MPLLDHLTGRELARRVDADRRTIDRTRAGQTPRRALRGLWSGSPVKFSAATLGATGETAAEIRRDRIGPDRVLSRPHPTLPTW
jgi:hypothetical protein